MLGTGRIKTQDQDSPWRAVSKMPTCAGTWLVALRAPLFLFS